MHKYYIMGYTRKPEECVLGHPLSDPLLYASCEIAIGQRIGNVPTDDFWVQMRERSPGLLVPDWINSTLRLPFVSAKLKALIERASDAEIEFVPFKIKNHKGRFANNEVHIANVIGTYDCVDHSNTEGVISRTSGEYLTLSKLSLYMDKIPADSKLFRTTSCAVILIVRDDLRAELEKENITGIAFIELGEKAGLL